MVCILIETTKLEETRKQISHGAGLNVKDTIAAAMRGEQTREGDYLASACRCPTGSSKVSMGLNTRASARSSERACLHGLTLPLRVPIGSGALTHLGGGEVLARLLLLVPHRFPPTAARREAPERKQRRRGTGNS